ncbi:MAG TPA: enoyl-CoA hydratase/isomerase family protein [Stellaceae bacterium]|jgi:enoyl-CoA hydratase
MSNEILTQQDGPVLRITINRPEQGNGMTDPMVVELTSIIREAPKTSRLIVLRGAGKEFCIGRAGMGAPRGAAPSAPPEAYARRNESDIVFDAYGIMRSVPIPVIAVVQGKALGFGCAIAAACDVTLASDAATFQVPEMGHNILPGMVMSSFIDRVPRKALSYLVWSTNAVSAERALSYGIVSDVFPAAKLDDAVEAFVAAVLKAPPIAVAGVKEFTRVAYDMPAPGAVDFARNLHSLLNTSSEMRRNH